jgi:pre-mRNA-splicing factor SYF1
MLKSGRRVFHFFSLFQAIYLLYAKLEENHGLARRALKIYERAIDGVLPDQLYELFNIFLKQAASMKGVTATREIFEKAIDVLKDDQARSVRKFD